MTEIPFIPSMRPEPRRDRFGCYILPNPTSGQDRAWTRATTLAHTLTDEFHLTQWKRRMVAEGLTKRPELLDRVSELARQIADAVDWRDAKVAKSLLDEVCDEAADAAGASDGSKLGTLLHTITEYADAGRYDEIRHLVPEELHGDLDVYTATMDAAGIRRPTEWIERIVVNTQVESGGTLDRWLILPDGRVVVGDLKTQKSIDFGFMEIAIQLAEYANADAMYDSETDELVPMPDGLDRSVGIVMHLPVGQACCTLYELDLEVGWHAAQVAYEARQLRSRSKAMGWPHIPHRTLSLSVDNTSVDQDLYLIRNAPHVDALVGLWRDLSTRGCWSELHTQEAAARKAQLTASVA